MALTVSDREQSASFYARYFGLTERMHEDDHLLIIADAFGGLLALSEGQDNRNWPRTTHFGFEMESTAEVINLRGEFMAGGVVEAEWQDSGPTRVQVFDPDGYRVEAFSWG